MLAAGGFRFTSLHSRVALRSTALRSIPFIVCLQPRLPAHKCVLHSNKLSPTRRFIPLPFGFPTHNPELETKTGSSIPLLPIRYNAFSHHTCFFQPNQRYVLLSVYPIKSGAPVLFALFSQLALLKKHPISHCWVQNWVFYV